MDELYQGGGEQFQSVYISNLIINDIGGEYPPNIGRKIKISRSDKMETKFEVGMTIVFGDFKEIYHKTF